MNFELSVSFSTYILLVHTRAVLPLRIPNIENDRMLQFPLITHIKFMLLVIKRELSVITLLSLSIYDDTMPQAIYRYVSCNTGYISEILAYFTSRTGLAKVLETCLI